MRRLLVLAGLLALGAASPADADVPKAIFLGVLPQPGAAAAIAGATVEPVGPRQAGLVLIANTTATTDDVIDRAMDAGIELDVVSSERAPATTRVTSEAAPADYSTATAPQLDDLGWSGVLGWLRPAATVAVIDTGYDASQPDLAGRVVDVYDATQSTGGKDVADHEGHGTAMLAIVGAAAQGTGAIGVAPNAPLIAVRQGVAASSPIANSVRAQLWVAGRATIVSMSFSGPLCGFAGRIAAGMITQFGGLPVASAGNNPNAPGPGCPAGLPHVLAVGWGGSGSTLARLATRGPGTDVSTLGDLVPALLPDSAGALTPVSGSSPATAVGAGAAALLAGQLGDNTGDRLLRTIQRAAAAGDRHPPGVDFGALSLPALLAAAPSPPDLQEPNEDVYWARHFPASHPALRLGDPVAASAGSFKDPRDVYRVRLPASRLRVDLSGLRDATVELFSPDALNDTDYGVAGDNTVQHVPDEAHIEFASTGADPYLAIVPSTLRRDPLPYRMQIRQVPELRLRTATRRDGSRRVNVRADVHDPGLAVVLQGRGRSGWHTLARHSTNDRDRAEFHVGRAVRHEALRAITSGSFVTAPATSRTIRPESAS